jgi:Ala-tRNA(Pro) deacylase
MAISISLKDFLDQHSIQYDLVPHKYTSNSLSAAHAAHIPGDRVAKSVLLQDDFGYMMAVLPATHRISLSDLKMHTHRQLALADENEISEIFSDCELGAIPPVGEAYGMETIVDDSIAEQSDIYLEAGDHEVLIHMESEQFADLMESADHSRFSVHI